MAKRWACPLHLEDFSGSIFMDIKRTDRSICFFLRSTSAILENLFATCAKNIWLLNSHLVVLTIPAVWQVNCRWLSSMWNIGLPTRWSNGCQNTRWIHAPTNRGFFFPLFWPLLGFWIYTKYQTYKASCGSSTARFLGLLMLIEYPVFFQQ